MQEPNYENFAKDNGISPAGEELEISGSASASNRWPREETLALLRIRSEMDAQFRDASPKGPLWEQVSRKLAELGYKRSSKKCREKFENVHKYYKRTKDCRSGQKDGKMYRFFEQLQTLQSATSAPNPTITSATSAPNIPSVTFPSIISGTSAAPNTSVTFPPIMPATSAPSPIQPTPISSLAPAQQNAGQNAELGPLGFTTSESGSESSDSEMTEAGGEKGSKKRKMMDLFEGLVKQVMNRQEEMQRLFLETLERREFERMAREDSWRRQETARLNREHEILAQERAIATSRDAALVSFIQRVSMQSMQTIQPSVMIPPLNVAVPAPPVPPKQQVLRPPLDSIVKVQNLQEKEVREEEGKGGNEIVLHEGYNNEGAPSSSRWPKIEVHTLIKLRTEMETEYHESGPRGPMWEEISGRMKKLGYNRNAKRCKEKWENINKYFKRVKESSKKRPEDSKTCPYFHDLDELYRKRLLFTGNGGGGSVVNMQVPSAAPSESESESRNGDESVTKKVNGG